MHSNVIRLIKEYIDNKHRTNESLIRRELTSDKVNYLQSKQSMLKELNRKNINNIIDFIESEKKFWNKVKISSQIEFTA